MASDDHEEGQVFRIGQAVETDTAQPIGTGKVVSVGQAVETTTAQPIGAIKGRGQSTASPSRSFGTGTVGRERWTFEILPPSDADGSFTVVLSRNNTSEVVAEAETRGDALLAISEWAMDQADE